MGNEYLFWKTCTNFGDNFVSGFFDMKKMLERIKINFQGIWDKNLRNTNAVTKKIETKTKLNKIHIFILLLAFVIMPLVV